MRPELGPPCPRADVSYLSFSNSTSGQPFWRAALLDAVWRSRARVGRRCISGKDNARGEGARVTAGSAYHSKPTPSITPRPLKDQLEGMDGYFKEDSGQGSNDAHHCDSGSRPRLCLTNSPRVYLHADSQSLTAVNGSVLSVSYLSVCDARGDASARRCWS